MNHKNCVEDSDKSLKDILKTNCLANEEKSFDGMTVLLRKDFRQILPIIVGESKEETIDASIN